MTAIGCHKRALLGVSTILATILAGQAWAADQAQPTTDAEIVVTAQKRAERLENVPVAITAISGTQLAAANVNNVRDLVSLTPGLRMDQTGIFTQPTIRGVGSAVTGPSNVGIYIDGFDQPSQAGNTFDLSNITQVEVLKGPQGTLFGRNATGGAILITTADPSPTPTGSIDASYRSYNDRRIDLYVSGPINEYFAANLSVYGRRSDGWKTDLVTRGHDAPNDVFDVRGKLQFKPADNLKFILTLQHSQITDPSAAAYSTFDGNSIGNLIPGAVVANGRFNTAMPNAPQNLVTANAAYLKGQYDMGWATLTSRTGYRSEKDKEQSELDRTSADLFTATWVQFEKTFTQEFLLNSAKSGPLNWVAGAYYEHDSTGYPYFLFNGFDAGGSTDTVTDAYAAFGDVTYEVAHNLFVTGGIRFSDETQTFSYDAAAAAASGLPTVASYRHTWTSVNERAVLRYEFAPHSNVYISYSNGFKSGAYNTLTFSGTPVDPEHIDAFEVGVKTAQRNWRFDASAFYYDYSNLQFTAYKFIPNGDGGGSTISELENAAKARIYGADGQLTYDFTRDFNINLGAAWTHARYVSFPGAIEYVPNVFVIGGRTILGGNSQISADAAGKTMVRAPDFTLSLGANYSHPLPYGRLTLSGNVYYSSTVYFDPTDSTSQSAYATLDLKATWTLPGDKISLSVFGNNVTDTKYVTQVAEDVFGYGAVYGTPSTFGAAVKYKF